MPYNCRYSMETIICKLRYEFEVVWPYECESTFFLRAKSNVLYITFAKNQYRNQGLEKYMGLIQCKGLGVGRGGYVFSVIQAKFYPDLLVAPKM